MSEVICAICGAKNEANSARCQACGAGLDSLLAAGDDDEGHTRSQMQESFEWRWVWGTLAINVALQVVALGVLPLVWRDYDPQGLSGLLVSGGIWFLSAFVVGRLSKNRTLIEPGIGALLAVGPTLAYLNFVTPEGLQPSTMAYVVTAILSVMASFTGAFFGERMRIGIKVS